MADMPRITAPVMPVAKARLDAMAKALDRPAYLLVEDGINALWESLSDEDRRRAEELVEPPDPPA